MCPALIYSRALHAPRQSSIFYMLLHFSAAYSEARFTRTNWPPSSTVLHHYVLSFHRNRSCVFLPYGRASPTRSEMTLAASTAARGVVRTGESVSCEPELPIHTSLNADPRNLGRCRQFKFCNSVVNKSSIRRCVLNSRP